MNKSEKFLEEMIDTFSEESVQFIDKNLDFFYNTLMGLNTKIDKKFPTRSHMMYTAKQRFLFGCGLIYYNEEMRRFLKKLGEGIGYNNETIEKYLNGEIVCFTKECLKDKNFYKNY